MIAGCCRPRRGIGDGIAGRYTLQIRRWMQQRQHPHTVGQAVQGDFAFGRQFLTGAGGQLHVQQVHFVVVYAVPPYVQSRRTLLRIVLAVDADRYIVCQRQCLLSRFQTHECGGFACHHQLIVRRFDSQASHLAVQRSEVYTQ